MYNAKTSFLCFQASHFRIKNQSEKHVFSNPLLGPYFSHWFSFKNNRLGGPLQNPAVAKMRPEINMFRRIVKKLHEIFRMLRFFSRPTFPETIVITVPFGPSGFQKVTLGRDTGSFSDLSAFLCAMFYITFLSLLSIKPW